jgi:hypothetical protein
MRALQPLQSLVSSDGRSRSIVNGTWNRVEDDVKQDQKDDPADACAILILDKGCS